MMLFFGLLSISKELKEHLRLSSLYSYNLQLIGKRMIKEPKYMVKFTSAYNDNGTVWYTVNVFHSREDESWSFKERYSRMRMIHENAEKTKWKNDLPMFPPRKLFGNTNTEFIEKRKKQLENYYSTLFRTVDIDEFPELLAFFNTNKPQKKRMNELQTKPKNLEVEPSAKPEKKDKQMKKIFEEIVSKTQTQMVQSNEFDPEIEDEVRRKFNQQFQKLKLDLRSPLIDNVQLPKGEKQNDTDFWNQFYVDSHQQNLKKLDKISLDVDAILRESEKCNIKFVIAL